MLSITNRNYEKTKQLWFVYMRVIITVNIGHMVTLILISTHMFHWILSIIISPVWSWPAECQEMGAVRGLGFRYEDVRDLCHWTYYLVPRIWVNTNSLTQAWEQCWINFKMLKGYCQGLLPNIVHFQTLFNIAQMSAYAPKYSGY